jgi:hypothetical protein
MNPRLSIAFATFAFSLAAAAYGQTSPGTQSAIQPSSVILPSAILQPAISNVQSTTANLDIPRWKAPDSVRGAAQENVDSIQRDLGKTLPTLLAQADAAPESVPQSFAVYRNVDALYDVLLRVSEVANLAAPSDEADSVASSLQRLEAARSQLGDLILHASQHREAQIVALESAARTVKAAPVAPKTETVIVDGPVQTHNEKVKKKTTSKKHETKPAAGTPVSGPTQ